MLDELTLIKHFNNNNKMHKLLETIGKNGALGISQRDILSVSGDSTEEGYKSEIELYNGDTYLSCETSDVILAKMQKNLDELNEYNRILKS